MRSANVAEGFGQSYAAKTIHGVSTEESKWVSSLQFVPKFLEADRGAPVGVSPKKRDHLPKDSQTVPALRRPSYDVPDHAGEAHRVRRAVNHEL